MAAAVPVLMAAAAAHDTYWSAGMPRRTSHVTYMKKIGPVCSLWGLGHYGSATVPENYMLQQKFGFPQNLMTP